MTELLYSIIRYVPDAVREERFNVGVVVVDGGRLKAKVLRPQQLGRLRKLGYGDNLRFLRSLEQEINAASEPHQQQLVGVDPVWSLEALQAATRDWGGTIQLSTPKPAEGVSKRDAVELFFDRFVAPPQVKHRPPDKRAIKDRVRRTLLRSVQAKYSRGNPERLVRRDDLVRGKLESHSFDFTLRNGRLLQIVQTVSFDVDTREILARELDAVKWAIKDVQDGRPGAPVTVVGMGSRQLELRQSLENLLPRLRAEFVPGEEIDVWARKVEGQLPDLLTEA